MPRIARREGSGPRGDPGDEARPRIEDIVAFRVPGHRVIRLHVATWHAGPHFVHDECLFVNLENRDTNRRDFHAVDLPVECRYRSERGAEPALCRCTGAVVSSADPSPR